MMTNQTLLIPNVQLGIEDFEISDLKEPEDSGRW